MPDRTVPTPARRQLLVGGTALLAALGLEPTASAAAGTASTTDAARGTSNSRLQRWARDTWHSLDAMTDPATGLPADNIPESLAAGDRSGYTSPTNVGGYLWSAIVARDLGIISAADCSARLKPHACGRWHDGAPRAERHVLQLVRPGHRRAPCTPGPTTAATVYPFVSSVDSGWLGAALLGREERRRREARAGSPQLCSTGCAGTPSTTRRDPGPPDGHRAGCMHGGFFTLYGRRPPGDGAYLGTHIGGDDGLADHPPLRHDRVGDPDHELPRHPDRPGVRPKHYFAAVAHLPGGPATGTGTRCSRSGVTRTYLGIDVYEGAYTYRGMHIVPGWGGSDVRGADAQRSSCPRRSGRRARWGVNHPLPRAGRSASTASRTPATATGASRRPATRSRTTASTASTRSGMNPDGLLLRPARMTELRHSGFGDCRHGDQPEPRLRGRRRHPARLLPRHDVRARRGHGQPDRGSRTSSAPTVPGGFFDAVAVAAARSRVATSRSTRPW